MAIQIATPPPDSVLPSIGAQYHIQGQNGIPLLLSRAATVALLIASLTLFLCILLSGFQWLTSGSEKAALQGARTRMTNCLIGLSIMALAWAVIIAIQFFFGIELFVV